MKNSVVAVMQMEHFGELEYREFNEEVSPTGVTEHSVLWTRNNPLLIEAALKAVKRHGVSRVQVSVPERPDIHGDQLERWRGVGAFARGALTNVEYRGEEGWDLPA